MDSTHKRNVDRAYRAGVQASAGATQEYRQRLKLCQEQGGRLIQKNLNLSQENRRLRDTLEDLRAELEVLREGGYGIRREVAAIIDTYWPEEGKNV